IPADERQLRPLPTDWRQASRTRQAYRARAPRERGFRRVDRSRSDPPIARCRCGAPASGSMKPAAGDPALAALPNREALAGSLARLAPWAREHGVLDALPQWLSTAADPAAGAGELPAVDGGGRGTRPRRRGAGWWSRWSVSVGRARLWLRSCFR